MQSSEVGAQKEQITFYQEYKKDNKRVKKSIPEFENTGSVFLSKSEKEA